MESENCEEPETFKQIFKNILKSDFVDLTKSDQETEQEPKSDFVDLTKSDNDQESTVMLKLNRPSELSKHFKCNICNFEFGQKNDLKKHNKLLHASDDNPSKTFVCNTCEIKFERRWLLENHMKAQHLNEKHFSCNACDYKSFYKQHIINHMVRKHADENGKVKRIFCSQCRFGTKHKHCDKDESHITDLELSKCKD